MTKQVEVKLEFDPWANESIEYELSQDDDLARRALDVEIDLFDFLEKIKPHATVDAYWLEHCRHCGSKWKIHARFSAENYEIFYRWKMPYITTTHLK